MVETLEQKSEKDKTCVWFILNKPYEPCPSCNRYNVDCPEYIPLDEPEIKRIDRIMRNLYKPDLRRKDGS